MVGMDWLYARNAKFWPGETHKYPGAVVHHGQEQPVPDGVVTFRKRNPVHGNAHRSDLALLFREQPPSAPSRGVHVVRKKDKGCKSGNEATNPFDNKQPLPPGKPMEAIHPRKDSRGNESRESGREDERGVENRSPKSQFSTCIPAGEKIEGLEMC